MQTQQVNGGVVDAVEQNPAREQRQKRRHRWFQ
jgi:hypothetical protein